MPQIDWTLVHRLEEALSDGVGEVVEGFNGVELEGSEVEGEISKEDIEKFAIDVEAQFKKIQWHNVDLKKKTRMTTNSDRQNAHKSSWRGGPPGTGKEEKKKEGKDKKEKDKKKNDKKKKDDDEEDDDDGEKDDEDEEDEESDEEDEDSEGKGDRLEFWRSTETSDYYVVLQAGDYVWIVGNTSASPFVVCNNFSFQNPDETSDSLAEDDFDTPEKLLRLLEDKTIEFLFNQKN